MNIKIEEMKKNALHPSIKLSIREFNKKRSTRILEAKSSATLIHLNSGIMILLKRRPRPQINPEKRRILSKKMKWIFILNDKIKEKK